MKWNATPLESDARAKVCKHAERKGWRPKVLKTPGRRGILDNYFTKAPGRIIFIEFKRYGEEPRPDQVEEIEALRAEGFEAHVIDTAEKGFAVFDNAD